LESQLARIAAPIQSAVVQGNFEGTNSLRASFVPSIAISALK
jgi:hypothetical protein